MDWDHDGKIDGRDSLWFHEVVCGESKNNGDDSLTNHSAGTGRNSIRKKSHQVGSEERRKQEIVLTPLSKIVLSICLFLCLAFLFMGAEWKAIINLFEIGVIAILVAQMIGE